MRLDWNDIRARAAQFAQDWKDARYERGETQTFYNEFFELFGISRRKVASFEFGVNLPANRRGYLDLFWKGTLLVEHKSAGRDLKPARRQALDYFPGLKDYELPRYILLSDFQTFELYDLDIDPDTPQRFPLTHLPDHVEKLGFIIGQHRRVFRDQDDVNVNAAAMMGALHDALDASGYRGHDLERLLVRLLFCLFGDDTGIFDQADAFENFIKDRTGEDGTHVGPMLNLWFETLDTPQERRQQRLSADLKTLEYINGDLFKGPLRIPDFDRDMRDKLLLACGFNWSRISPAIFGSLFQSVMKKEERRKKGAHYTTEKNILKVIEPLFLDKLRNEFEKLRARRDTGRAKALHEFHDKLARLTFFDPACGCGNFLVIAYRELRELEIRVLKELYPDGQRVTDIGLYVKVNVNQFYGIELEEFPARIAEVSLWMMDHIMNRRVSEAFGKSYLRFPLTASPNILHADALETDWAALLPPDKCSYVFGNPPFVGAKYQSEAQRAQVRRIAGLGGSGGTLDYVCAWFLKAGAYVQDVPTPPRIAFVATNSITQGEQVAQLWPVLFERHRLEIAFGHRTFEWTSEAKGKAHVHCVIIGLARRDDAIAEKRLFSYEDIKGEPVESRHAALSPYLFDAGQLQNRHLVVKEVSRPLGDAPKLVSGSQPIDDGNYIFTEEERLEFLAAEPGAAAFLRPYIGADEYIYGTRRWILALQTATPEQLRAMPRVLERMRAVRAYREKSKRKSTRHIAPTPTRYNVEVIPTKNFLSIPEISSEQREYVPIGWLQPPTIPSNKLRFIEQADLYHFGVLTSKMHNAWTKYVGGRLKSDYQYSIGINYNPFPWPAADEKAKTRIRHLAQAVLDARAAHPGSTLADLYDPLTMPPDLRKAHRALDEAVDRLYRAAPFSGDRERVEHLFRLYEEMTAGLLAAPARPRGKRRRAAPSPSAA